MGQPTAQAAARRRATCASSGVPGVLMQVAGVPEGARSQSVSPATGFRERPGACRGARRPVH